MRLMTTLNSEQIKKLLPHRYPFLLVDKVLDYQAGESLRAIKNVAVNEPFFLGHFPGKSVMPGVLIVEAMAQAAAILGILSGAEPPPEETLYYLVGVDKARFRKPAVPGDQLLMEVKFVAVRRNIWKFSATTRVDGRLIASTELLTTTADSES